MKKIIKWVTGLPFAIYSYLKELSEKAKNVYTKKAVDITTVIKDFLNNPALDVITLFTKTTADEKVLMVARSVINKVVAQLVNIADLPPDASEEQLKQFLLQAAERWHLIKDEDKAEFYTGLAAKLKVQFSKVFEDGRLTFGEAVSIVETFYKTK